MKPQCLLAGAAIGLLLGGLLSPLLGVHKVNEHGQLPDLEGLHLGPCEPEPVGDQSEVLYSSPSVGSTGSELVLIFNSPACSQVKSGFSRFFTM